MDADHGHPISSPCEPNGSGELKTGVCRGIPIFLIYSLEARRF